MPGGSVAATCWTKFFFEFGVGHRIDVRANGAGRNPYHAQTLHQVIHTIHAVGYAKLPGQQLAYVFAPHPTAAAFALQLFNRLAKRLFLLFGKALAVLQSCGRPARRATLPAVNHCTQRITARVQCSGHFGIALAVLEVRQRNQAQSPAPILFFVSQPVEVIGLELINDLPR